MTSFILREISDSISVKEKLNQEAKSINECFETISKKIQKRGKILVFGNGGSAADAQHLAAELIGRFQINRDPIPAIALTTNSSNLTAISNDYSFEDVFSRQVKGLATKDDVVIGISTSGTSPNVLNGLKAAKQIGSLTIALTGKGGKKLKNKVDFCIMVPSNDTQRIQECHILLIHMLCGILETSLEKNK